MDKVLIRGGKRALLASVAMAAFAVAPGCGGGGGGGGVNPLTPQLFLGVGPSATTAMNSMRTAIGGSNNGGAPLNPTTPGVGRREVNWDAVVLTGGDFGGATTTIQSGNLVIIPTNRFQARGVAFSELTAVSGNGFTTSANTVAGLFPAFSAANTFSTFNDGTADTKVTINFVEPTNTPGAAPVRGVRGFGVMFLDVNREGSASVEYFSGTRSLGKVNALASATPGQPSFVGALFNQPYVTSVVITSGDRPLFSFAGGLVPGAAQALPGIDLVAMDDFIFSEPQAATPAP